MPAHALRRPLQSALIVILIRLADQSSLDLAADRLWQLIHVLDHTRILVGRSQLLDMLLQLLGQFFRRCIALGKHDRRLDDLSADRIRDACDGTLNDCVVSNQGRLDLERSDTVAGALDDVVISSAICLCSRVSSIQYRPHISHLPDKGLAYKSWRRARVCVS